MGRAPTNSDEITTLKDVLEVASGLVRRMSENSLLQRIIAVFQAMPEADRPTIIDVLEREVLGRHLSRGTEQPIGQASRPNPNARLYIRWHEPIPDATQFDFEQMRVANVRAMRVAGIIRYVPGIYALFNQALRAALQEVDEPTRAVAEGLLNDVLTAIAEVRATEATVPPGSADATPPDSSGGAPDAPTGMRRAPAR